MFVFLLTFVLIAAANVVGSPIEQREIRCQEDQPGEYVVGCSQHYTVCDAEGAHHHTCPVDLFYSPCHKRCELKCLIHQCSEPIFFRNKVIKAGCLEPWMHAASMCDETSICLFSGVNKQAAQGIKIVNKTEECLSCPGGDLVIGCTKSYTRCGDNGSFEEKVCPRDLWFNSCTGQCDYKCNIPHCRNPNYARVLLKDGCGGSYARLNFDENGCESRFLEHHEIQSLLRDPTGQQSQQNEDARNYRKGQKAPRPTLSPANKENMEEIIFDALFGGFGQE